MDKKDKIKNILDLEYQTYLNYFNIVVISIITSFISIIVGTMRSWDIKILFSLVILVMLSIVLVWLVFSDKLARIKRSIQEV
ncbi:hypothetical protein HYW76_01965 [Candidatus Pacearchaeota archaeon]|nr:hypothetical protein [Candidatus Pacearchaeota archaeon]